MGRSLLLAAVLVGAVAGSAEARSGAGCDRALIVSAKTGKVLQRPLLSPLSVAADGRDGWYVADTRLWHVRRDGSVDDTWHSPVRRSLTYRMRDAAPGMLARRGNRLYLAGRQRVVAVDTATGRVLWRSPPIAGPTGDGTRASITALAAGSRALYLGGSFTSVGGARRVGLAALDPSTGRLLPWQARPVRAVALLALAGSTLYFSASSRIGAVRTRDGQATSFAPQARLTDPIMLAAWRGLVLLGCSTRASLCESDTGVFDGRTGKPMHKFAFDEVPSAGAVALAGSTAYLGAGSEADFGGQHYLIAIDLRTGKFENWFPKAGYHVAVESMAISGGRVLAAGSFCPGP